MCGVCVACVECVWCECSAHVHMCVTGVCTEPTMPYLITSWALYVATKALMESVTNDDIMQYYIVYIVGVL